MLGENWKDLNKRVAVIEADNEGLKKTYLNMIDLIRRLQRSEDVGEELNLLEDKINPKLTFNFEKQPEGGFTVTCDELPPFITEGNTLQEAFEHCKDCFEVVMELYEDFNKTLPEALKEEE